jgi:hypothetical protein
MAPSLQRGIPELHFRGMQDERANLLARESHTAATTSRHVCRADDSRATTRAQRRERSRLNRSRRPFGNRQLLAMALRRIKRYPAVPRSAWPPKTRLPLPHRGDAAQRLAVRSTSVAAAVANFWERVFLNPGSTE